MYIKSLPLFVLISSGLLNAAVVPGRWEKVDSLPPGQQIIVTLKAGDSIECSLKESETDDLTVVTSTGSELKLAKSEVRKIVSAEKTGDSLLNGTLIGAGVGGAISILPFIIIGARSDVDLSAENMGLIGLLIGGGAAVGLAADAAIKGHEVLYQAP